MNDLGRPPNERLAYLRALLAQRWPETDAAAALLQLVHERHDQLPQPGGGATLQRWQVLAEVAAHDLSLAKLFEGHTDALAILRELSAGDDSFPPGATWGVWAAEAPGGRVRLRDGPGGVRLDGRKHWCSGAVHCSHALLTAWPDDGEGPQLVAIELEQPGIEVHHGAWAAIGMAGSASLDVQLNDVRGQRIGGPGEYLSRPGFWQGGAGIAACWLGGARMLARALHSRLADTPPEARDPHRLAALGRVDVAMATASAALREAADWMDQHPRDDAAAVALRARLAAEAAATRVLDEAGRALGATPFCRDARFARMAADLPVFVRQSHAERDFAALAQRLLAAPEQAPWAL